MHQIRDLKASSLFHLLCLGFFVFIASINSNAQSSSNQIPDEWVQRGNLFEISLDRYRLDDKIVFEANGKRGDAIFIDQALVFLFEKDSVIHMDKRELMEVFGPKNSIKFAFYSKKIEFQSEFGFKIDKVEIVDRINIIATERPTSERTFYGFLLLGLLLFFGILRFLFPEYFGFVVTSLRSTIGYDLQSNFNNGAILLSVVVSAIIFSFVYVNGLGEFEWMNLAIGFGSIVLFIAIKFMFNRIMIFAMDQNELLTGFYLDWLFNIIRMSFLLIVLYVFMGLLAIDVSWFYEVAPILVILIPTIGSILTVIKNIKLLPFNYLFLYLCALEILPASILVQAL